MAVAYIAYRNLNPAARARADALLERHPHFRDWTRGVEGPPERRRLVAFCRAATWADAIRDDKRYEDGDGPVVNPKEKFSEFPSWDFARHPTWHFINVPFSPDGTAQKQPSAPNVLTQIRKILASLRDPGVADDARTYELPWLLHLVGDVHQPLHCVSRFAREFPDGDRGGNSILVDDRAPNLHAFWDGALGAGSDPETVAMLGDSILAEFDAHAPNADPEAWVAEGVELARELVYSFDARPHPEHISRLSGDYRVRAGLAARRRAALAGYRLAAALNAALG